MNSSPIGKITQVPITQIWPSEPRNFTPFLQENLGLLRDVVGMDLIPVEREAKSENFYLDLLTENENGERIVIENQYGVSDHKHLGQVLTYLASFDAHAAIWIVEDAKSEHIKAVNFLNESNIADFYLVKVEAIRIGESLPAPLFTKIVGPSEQTKVAGAVKKEGSELKKLRYSFWESLLNQFPRESRLFDGIQPGQYSFLGKSAGRRDLAFQFWVTNASVRVQLTIDHRENSNADNRRILQALEAKKEKIENDFGGQLVWDDVAESRVCKVYFNVNSGGLRSNPSLWPTFQKEAIGVMIRLEKALSPHIKKL